MALLRKESKVPFVSNLDVHITYASELPPRSTGNAKSDQGEDEDEFNGSQLIEDETEFNDAKEELESIVGPETPAAAGVGDETKDVEPQVISTSESSIADTGVTPKSFCTVKLRIEYTPSKKDQQEKLYESLNQASKRKSLAIERLRKSAAAVSRGSTSSKEEDGEEADLGAAPSRAVQPGFLNKKRRPRSKGASSNVFVDWYNRILGPQSALALAFPIAKNYCLFFGFVAFVHWKGDLLALPPPI